MHLTRPVDLTGVESATLLYDVYHDIEQGYDFAYLFVSEDGGETWTALTAENMQGLAAEDDPSESALSERFYTGRSDGWRSERVDLTPYAGKEVLVRLAYLTDLILTFGGLAIDNIAIPEIDFSDDVEQPLDGWQAEGFERVTATIPQRWHLQLITFTDGLPVVEQLTLEDGHKLSRQLSLADSGGEAILIVAASAPMTLEPARYELGIGDR
jgi:bacillopeptidase F (M6 metalloprotease family)